MENNYTVQGLAAIHSVEVMDAKMTDEVWSSERHQLQEWQPESHTARSGDSGFEKLQHARAWLTRMLKKHGWPHATKWRIYPFGARFLVYRLEPSNH